MSSASFLSAESEEHFACIFDPQYATEWH